MKVFQISILLALSALVAACGQQLNGVYKDELGVQKYEFKTDGVVYVSTLGATKEATYTLEDRKVKIIEGGDTHIYDLNEDGTIKGPLGIILKPEPPK